MKSTLLVILTLLSAEIYSQTHTADPRVHQTVISVHGLKLRKGPDMQSSVIYTIPFLDKVHVLEQESSDLDTLAVFKFDNNVGGEYKDPLCGDWVKVNHKGQEGFVFSAYIMFLEPRDAYGNYEISYAGTTCFDNIQRKPDIEWKGLYKVDNGYAIKDVQVSYYKSRGELTGFGTTTSDNSDLILLIGSSENKLENGSVEGSYFSDFDKRFVNLNDHSKNQLDGFRLEGEGEGEKMSLFLEKEGRNQQINTGIYGVPNCLLWQGDLDRDGEDDYIIIYGEKGGGHFLYLSSEAFKGDFVRPVAVYSSGYCC